MGLPQLETACFVLDLKTGNIVLGCINAVFSFAMTIVMLVLAVEIWSIEKAVEKNDPNAIDEEARLTGASVLSIVLLLLYLAKFCFDVVYVYGVIAERQGIIKAYCITWIVFFFLSLFTFFINVEHFGVTTILSELAYLGINIYVILLSRSFYKQLNEREEV